MTDSNKKWRELFESKDANGVVEDKLLNAAVGIIYNLGNDSCVGETATKIIEKCVSPLRDALEAAQEERDIAVAKEIAATKQLVEAQKEIAELKEKLGIAINGLKATPCVGNGAVHILSCLKCAVLEKLK